MIVLAWRGESLELLHERALWWRERRTLVIADPHWGKAAAFRAGGIPVPEGGTAADLARLSGTLARCGAERLVILGDCIHARAGRDAEVFALIAGWRARHGALAIDLVSGNHDRHAGDPPDDWRIAVHRQPIVDGPFVLAHEPRADPAGYCLAGHVHPAVRLRDRGGGTLRTACFHFARDIALLPAFGSFTGTADIRPTVGDRIFAVGPGAVVEIAVPASRSGAQRG